MVRISLCWLLTGFVFGAMMMADSKLDGAWRIWMGPTHGHMLFVGWFLQFTLGIAFWLLPRVRTPDRPLGYRERLALGAVVLLNVGLLLRAVAEPAQRSGHDAGWTDDALIVSGIAQVVAATIFIIELWPRAAARQRRRAASTSSSATVGR